MTLVRVNWSRTDSAQIPCIPLLGTCSKHIFMLSVLGERRHFPLVPQQGLLRMWMLIFPRTLLHLWGCVESLVLFIRANNKTPLFYVFFFLSFLYNLSS